MTALVLGWVEDSVFRSDSRVLGVAGSFSPCAFAWIVSWRRALLLANCYFRAGDRWF